MLSLLNKITRTHSDISDVSPVPGSTELTAEYLETILYLLLPFIALYWHLVPEISFTLFPKLKLQTDERINSFVSDCISIIPSTLTGYIAVRAFYYYVPDDPEGMFNCFKWCSMLMSAYLLADTVYRYYYIKWQLKFMILHHAVGLVIVQVAMFDRGWLLQKLVFCLMEIANPFINLRLMMLALGFSKTSKRYKSVSVAMVFTFTLTRILPIPYMVKCGLDMLLSHPETGTWVHTCMFVLYLLLSVMNLYWFNKMLRGLALMIRNKDHPDA